MLCRYIIDCHFFGHRKVIVEEEWAPWNHVLDGSPDLAMCNGNSEEESGGYCKYTDLLT